MSKKDFKGGLGSLLGETSSEEPKTKAQAKRGRPRTQTKKVEKSSEEGTLEGEIRATFIANKITLEKYKAVIYWERKRIKDHIAETLENVIKAYESEHGEVKPIPKK